MKHRTVGVAIDITRFERVCVVYLVDDAIGSAHIGTRTMSMLVPVSKEKILEEAFLIAQAKLLLAADYDVGEEQICIVSVYSALTA